jgi:hypothetical protein
MEAKSTLLVVLAITFAGTSVGQTTAQKKAAAAATEIHPAAPALIKNNGDGTVTDKKAGLVWEKEKGKAGDKPVPTTWRGAAQYCSSLSLAGHSDWILPSKDQLVSLWNDGGFRSRDSSFYWSSETDRYESNLAWIVSSKDGQLSHAPSSENNTDYLNYLNYARCVEKVWK